MSSTEKFLAQTGLSVAVMGAILGLFILFASGMSGDEDSARRQVFIAFPVPALGLTLSACSLVPAYRHGSIRGILVTALSGIVIAGGTVLVAVPALKTYR